MRVLLTEDEPLLADLLIEFLRDEGHEVVVACDLERAGELVRAVNWDAWVVDPSGDGFTEPDPDYAAQLRRLAAHVSTVVTTGQAWARRITPADLGVRAILNKPYELSDLEQALESISTSFVAHELGD
jgi:DNA-binding response OmpR family regulator